MKRARLPLLALLVSAAAGCPMDGLTSSTSSGIRGEVLRGPVTPVCRVDVPCYAPFAATFYVQRAGVTLATLTSDSTGHFVVYLSPGAYTIVPGPDAPIPFAASQAKSVQVQAGTLTSAQLTFDTFLR
jgi:hypothetical protein